MDGPLTKYTRTNARANRFTGRIKEKWKLTSHVHTLNICILHFFPFGTWAPGRALFCLIKFGFKSEKKSKNAVCEGENVSGRRTQSCTNDGQQRLLHHHRNNLGIDRICIWRFHPSFFVLSYDSVDKAFSTRLCWFAFTIFWYDNLYKIVGTRQESYAARKRHTANDCDTIYFCDDVTTTHSYNINNRRRRNHRAEFSESIWSGLCCCCDSTQ